MRAYGSTAWQRSPPSERLSILFACAFGGDRDTAKVYTLPLCLTSLLATAATTGKGSAIGKGEAEGWRGEEREES